MGQHTGWIVGFARSAHCSQHKRNLALTDDCFRRSKAVEFPFKQADESQSPLLLEEAADIIETPLRISRIYCLRRRVKICGQHFVAYNSSYNVV
eukprot:scaffold144763_cov55-Attheya_sp.AAC.1